MRAPSGILGLLALCAALVGTVVPAECRGDPIPPAKRVQAIRHWTAPDHTRIVLDMSGESVYRIRSLTDPHRVVIDIPGGKIDERIRAVTVGDGVLDRIRVNRLKSGAQVVIDVPRQTAFRDFGLKPYKDRPHRIVVDLERHMSPGQVERERARAAEIARSGDCVVIIDPGHGGSEPGACSRSGQQEKDIVLQISLLAAREIETHKGFKAVLTRSGDYNVGLQRRIDIARSHGGHCFVSVHVNSHTSSKPRGFEVFFLSAGGATDENAQAVAERENLLVQMGEEGRDMPDDVQSIIFDLARNDVMHKSSQLAGEIAGAVERSPIVPFRAIKQANFVVLRSIAMPSVLVECLFLSNKKDIQLLKQRNVLEEMARCLAKGIVTFLTENPPTEAESIASRAMIHTVAAGETLWGIARMYGVSVAQLRNINGLDSRGRIRPGQKLYIRQ